MTPEQVAIWQEMVKQADGNIRFIATYDRRWTILAVNAEVEQLRRENAALRGWIDGKITTGELEEALKNESLSPQTKAVST